MSSLIPSGRSAEAKSAILGGDSRRLLRLVAYQATRLSEEVSLGK
jgi:hypothetical protein